MRNVDEKYMKLALDEAMQALAEGEVPIGCVIVKDGEVIGCGHNRVEELKDASAHAEILAIRKASGAVENWRLNGATAYVTVEPCPMCASALIFSRVGRIVFGAKNPHFGACGTIWNLPDEPAFENHPIICEGIMVDVAEKLMRTFFDIIKQ